MGNNEVLKIFSRNFKRLLIENDKKQVDIVNLLGVSSAIVAQWSQGKKMPRPEKLKKIADYFGVTVSELLEDKPRVAVSGIKIEVNDPNCVTLITLYSQLDSKGKEAVLTLARTLAK